jgi:hypothetical protein
VVNRYVQVATPQNPSPAPPSEDPQKQGPPIYSGRAPQGTSTSPKSDFLRGIPFPRTHITFIGNFDKKSPWPTAGIGMLDQALPQFPLGL